MLCNTRDLWFNFKIVPIVQTPEAYSDRHSGHCRTALTHRAQISRISSCAYLISLNIVSSSFIYSAANDGTLLFLYSMAYIYVCVYTHATYHIFFIQLPEDRQLG